MGVPRLRQLLQPYGDSFDVVEELNEDDVKLSVDGSAFAHFIYWRLYNHQDPALGLIDAQPTYHEIGAAAVQFLADLEALGFVVNRIFFDGYLPDVKIETRVKRLASSLTTLLNFRRVHNHALQLSTGKQVENFTSEDEVASTLTLLQEKSCPEELRGRVAAPFLVPAVLETLYQSRFSTITELVPEEAEAYCARQVNMDGGILLTSDSDALLYDLGDEGSVCFFHELHFIPIPFLGPRLRAVLYQPAFISDRLKIPSLFCLAGVLEEHGSWSLDRLVDRVRADVASQSGIGYARVGEFLMKPQSLHSKRLEKTRFDARLLNHYKNHQNRLDPRISELVLNLAGPHAAEGASIYMAQLFEDPQRKTAWDTGIKIRELAYWCLAAGFVGFNPDKDSIPIVEFARKGERIVPKKWNFKETQKNAYSNEAEKLCAEFLHLRLHLSKPVNEAGVAFYWRSLAARQFVQSLTEEGLTYSCPCCTAKLIFGVNENEMTWDTIHKHAKIEAQLYSLRILKQSLSFIESCDALKKLPASIINLKSDFDSLPSLAELIPTRRGLKNLWDQYGSQYSSEDLGWFLSCDEH